ncbi:2OG-Fe(II) oxygenase [Nocardia sp. NPDC023988]|uniref:2OG-Fe(II) oxygenase n=1 Tax=unclassified Nocardia TaxID=2637762 RepID=UPI00340C2586
MSEQTLRAIAELVESARPNESFVARRTIPAEHLRLSIHGLGGLEWPVTPERAAKIRTLARPARYGLGELTLLDPTVRDTWEIPAALVTVEEERWNSALTPILDELRTELGLPAHSPLTAELHSMLLYEPGQFFRRHRDSEKADGMIATLVVTLPGTYVGGELVVEHRGESFTEQGSPDELVLTAFYADCEHEVLPVTTGHRITLTYNLITNTSAAALPAPPDALTHQLRQHFTDPAQAELQSNGRPVHAPSRLVYLLDHQYTQRGLTFDQLKGADAARVSVLRSAAEVTDCGTALVLVEICETFEGRFEDSEWMYGRSRRWERRRDEWIVVDESWEPHEEPDLDTIAREFRDNPDFTTTPVDHPDRIAQSDPTDTDVTLTWWSGEVPPTAAQTAFHVDETELCDAFAAPGNDAYAFESAGFLGNEGNTADRWYRRAAIVVWPRNPVEPPRTGTDAEPATRGPWKRLMRRFA